MFIDNQHWSAMYDQTILPTRLWHKKKIFECNILNLHGICDYLYSIGYYNHISNKVSHQTKRHALYKVSHWSWEEPISTCIHGKKTNINDLEHLIDNISESIFPDCLTIPPLHQAVQQVYDKCSTYKTEIRVNVVRKHVLLNLVKHGDITWT